MKYDQKVKAQNSIILKFGEMERSEKQKYESQKPVNRFKMKFKQQKLLEQMQGTKKKF